MIKGASSSRVIRNLQELNANDRIYKYLGHTGTQNENTVLRGKWSDQTYIPSSTGNHHTLNAVKSNKETDPVTAACSQRIIPCTDEALRG